MFMETLHRLALPVAFTMGGVCCVNDALLVWRAARDTQMGFGSARERR